MSPVHVKPHASRLDLTVYPHQVEVQSRFADLDPQWHLNNVRLVELYQEARTSFNLEIWGGLNLDARSHRLLVARQSIDYLGEVEWPGPVCIGAGIAHIGNKSYSIGLAMFQRGKCVGVSDAVLVYATEQGTAPLPDGMREVLRTKMLPKAEVP
jgi:acyl-CoA thioester hydrolase